MRILVIAEHDNASTKPATRNAVTAALQIGGEIDLMVAGYNCGAAADDAAKIAGVDRVLVADTAHYADQSPENIAALIVAHAESYSHVLTPATSSGKNILPRVAALLDVAQISEIVAVLSDDTFVRPIYAGNVLATVHSPERIKIITVRPTAFKAAGEGTSVSIENLGATADHGKSKVLARELTQSARPELSAAKVVIAGGRGLGSRENFHALLEPLADKLGAALAASRAAVDADFVANDLQVGQTGKVVAPQLYIAIGISGAIQHLAGMKESQVIVAINKDPEAPIFQVADYGLVADLFLAVPALTAALDGELT